MLRCGLTNKYEYWGCGRWCACLTHDSFLQRADYVLLGERCLQRADYVQQGVLCLPHGDYAQPDEGCLQRVGCGLQGVLYLRQGLVLLTLQGDDKTPTYDIQLCRAPSYPSCQRHLA
jgi:hypothetical protein